MERYFHFSAVIVLPLLEIIFSVNDIPAPNDNDDINHNVASKVIDSKSHIQLLQHIRKYLCTFT